METAIEQAIPEQWKGLFRLLIMPIAWVLPFQQALLQTVWRSELAGLTPLKWLFLIFPAAGVVIGVWCTMLSVYTIAFRGNRLQFIGTELVLWWDFARSVWLFWFGMIKFVLLFLGTVTGCCRLVVEAVLSMVREMIELPFVLTGSLTQTMRQPGVPWIAFLMTVFWGALEGVIFAYILTPMVGEIISDLVGNDATQYLVYFLFVMLWALILGSLACMHVLVEAIKSRDIPQILQMIIVEIFVMFMEVMFFYRELIDALTPWIAQQTGMQVGLGLTLMMASFGWLGIRGMVWFLFARFGTPTLLAIISRQRLATEAVEQPVARISQVRWEGVITQLKRDQAWFEEKSHALLEAAALPCFQLLAATINFPVVLFLSSPIFNLPFKNLAEVGETKALLQKMAIQRVPL